MRHNTVVEESEGRIAADWLRNPILVHDDAEGKRGIMPVFRASRYTDWGKVTVASANSADPLDGIRACFAKESSSLTLLSLFFSATVLNSTPCGGQNNAELSRPSYTV